MSLQALFSFDHIIASDLITLPKVVAASGVSISSSGGRGGTGGMISTASFNQGLIVALDNPHSNVTLGTWISINHVATGTAWEILGFGHPNGSDSNDPWGMHISLVPKADASIAIHRGSGLMGTQIGQTVGGVYTPGTPFYLEWQTQIAPAGYSILKINEVEVLHLNNANTAVLADTNAKMFIFGGGNGNVMYDDTYILTGEDNGDGWTDFRGIITITSRLANGAGDLTQWAPSTPTGVNWDNVNDDIPSVVDYNDAASVGLIDLYQFEDVTFEPIAIEVDMYLRKLDAGPCSTSHVLRVGGTDFVNAEIKTLNTAYKYMKRIYTKQPGGSPWTQAVFNALQAGPKRVV